MTHDLKTAIRRRITFHTLKLISTPPSEARKEGYAAIRDLETLLNITKRP